ncbi:DNA fragmentation factor subunit beta [Synchiropus splendidus]|uniref:DNA fragmentation factor subunit beta n=1 Tax=Synchiropus splendidus TaxID=270530 RepID=UPI00237E5C00|nr:DNA fragmentation factor subunit beta [Synchiropus splendidus]
MKPVKIRSYNGSKKFGVAAKDLKELLKKGCKLLQLPISGAHVSLHEDGTNVTEEFFTTLPVNTELVLLARDQTWDGALCEIGNLLGSDQQTSDLIKAAKALLFDPQSPKRRKILMDLLQKTEDRSELESRDDDEEWFQDIKPRFKTKSAYMEDNCKNRIRSYLTEVKAGREKIKDNVVVAKYSKISELMEEMLKSANYNGCYFDRTSKESNCLCTKEGWFTCQGAFDEAACQSLHSINPYSSRESRIIFSMWNLDHRIEKKRTIIPALQAALQDHKTATINVDYFYRLLFTRENLKLVHIVCHKKSVHNLECDAKKIFKQSAAQPKKKKAKRK